MKILHYSLGLPPFRTGGMTRYCLDLMSEQIKKGYDVSFIYPGVLRNKKKTVKVKSHGRIKVNNFYINKCYEIINPLPIPLLDGIKDIKLFQISKDINIFNDFFSKNNYDVLHIHTFMGMPYELLEAAKRVGVRLIYTSHDYFSVCPRGNLFNNGKICIDDNECHDCILCNKNALSYEKMYLLQSNFYRILKDKKFIRDLRKKHNNQLYNEKLEFNNNKSSISNYDEKLSIDYKLMRKKNMDWLNKFDIVHFNSKNTLEIYKRYGKTEDNSKIISISNESILDQRKKRNKIKIKSVLSFGYLGPITTHKGYQLLKHCCDLLWDKGIKNFEVHIFSHTEDNRPYFKKHSPYTHEELENVMKNFDILVVPSLCNETFGFTTLEALSFGVPVIVTENVGAKDLVFNDKNGRIVNANINDLFNVMKELIISPNKVHLYQKWILEKGNVKTMSQHSEEILDLYKL
ncbi:glycosyltransferase [Clostridium perfringens]|uniref:Glycosyltransferase n=1 Tax=Clostridium perfringens TaxID=1502 RepID=A0AAN5SFD2_CLOPF|nr:glycosyltransferase [Clostridium perfringens]MBO3338119.1 glycosyltransferase [Clostridium perfringens]MBO3385686.1 glycosyltransferase [Clostridium perfringens]MBO3398133.1 glycosyltransferase [Clostridium perfringens]MBO3417196.1 glycosyltransferase [Clostridium perfringens]MBO3420351.1 glycosyltransferase [Clostridium perfringens]